MHMKLVWGSKENDEMVARAKAEQRRAGSKPRVVRTVDPYHWFWFGFAIMAAGCVLLAWSWYKVSTQSGPIPSDDEATLTAVLTFALCLTGGIIIAQAERKLSRRE
jgi:hypothetical protein